MVELLDVTVADPLGQGLQALPLPAMSSSYVRPYNSEFRVYHRPFLPWIASRPGIPPRIPKRPSPGGKYAPRLGSHSDTQSYGTPCERHTASLSMR